MSESERFTVVQFDEVDGYAAEGSTAAAHGMSSPVTG